MTLLIWEPTNYSSGRVGARASGHEGSWLISPCGEAIYDLKFQRAFPEGEGYASIMARGKEIEAQDGRTDEARALWSYCSAQDFGFVDSIEIGKLVIERIRQGNSTLPTQKSARELMDENFTFTQEVCYTSKGDLRFPQEGIIERHARFYKFRTEQEYSVDVVLEESDISARWEPGGKYSYLIFGLKTHVLHFDHTDRTLIYYPDGVTDVRQIGAQFILDTLIPWVEAQDMRKRYFRGQKKVVD